MLEGVTSAISNLWNTLPDSTKAAFRTFAADFAGDALDAVKEEAKKDITGQQKWDGAFARLSAKVAEAGWKNAEGFTETVLQSAYQVHAIAEGKVPTIPRA